MSFVFVLIFGGFVVLTEYYDDDVSVRSMTLTPVNSDDDSSLSGPLPSVASLIHRGPVTPPTTPRQKCLMKPVKKKISQSRQDTQRNSLAKIRRELQSTLRVLCFCYTKGHDTVLSDHVIQHFFRKSVNMWALPASQINLNSKLSVRLCAVQVSCITHCADLILNHFLAIISLIESDPQNKIFKSGYLLKQITKKKKIDKKCDFVELSKIPENRADMISALLQDGQMTNRVAEFISECKFGSIGRSTAWNNLQKTPGIPLGFFAMILDFIDCASKGQLFSRVQTGTNKSKRAVHEQRDVSLPVSMRQLVRSYYRFKKGVMYKGFVEPYLTQNPGIINHPRSFRDEWKLIIPVNHLTLDKHKQSQIWSHCSVIAALYELSAPLIPSTLGHNLFWNYQCLGSGLAACVTFCKKFVQVFCHWQSQQMDHDGPHGVPQGTPEELIEIWGDKAVACLFVSMANPDIKTDCLLEASLFPWLAEYINMKPRSGAMKQYSEYQLNRSLREVLCVEKSERKFETYKDKSYTQNMLACTNNWHRVQDDDDTARRDDNLNNILQYLTNKWDAVGGMITTATIRVNQQPKFWKENLVKKSQWYSAVHRQENKKRYIQNGKYYGKGNLVTHGAMYDMMTSDLFKHAVPVFDRYDILHHGCKFDATKRFGDPLLYGFTESDESDSEDALSSDDESIDIIDSESDSNSRGEGIAHKKNKNSINLEDTNDLKMDILEIDCVTTKMSSNTNGDDWLVDGYLDDTLNNSSNSTTNKTKTKLKKNSKVYQQQTTLKQAKNSPKNTKKKKKKFKRNKNGKKNLNQFFMGDLIQDFELKTNFNSNKFADVSNDGFQMPKNVSLSKNNLSANLFEKLASSPPVKKRKLNKSARKARRRPGH